MLHTKEHCTALYHSVQHGGASFILKLFCCQRHWYIAKSERNDEGLFANSWPSRKHRCVLQHDSDSMLFLKCIKQDNIMFLVWCSQSTNLKSIEHLWTVLESWVYARKQSNSNCFPCEEKKNFFHSVSFLMMLLKQQQRAASKKWTEMNQSATVFLSPSKEADLLFRVITLTSLWFFSQAFQFFCLADDLLWCLF